MEYRDFVEQVKEQIQDFLPERFADAAVEVNQIVKNNDCVLDGLMVRTEESNIAPTIYLNPYFEQMQDRITGFVVRHSNISEERFTQLMMRTGELVMDVGTVLDGQQAVEEGLIDQLGSVGEALHYLYQRIDGELPGPNEQAAPRRRRKK